MVKVSSPKKKKTDSDASQMLEKASNVAAAVRMEAEVIALDLVEHAKETARQMLLNTNLDTSKIPLICNKIIKIQSDLSWMRWLLLGLTGGVGYIALQVLLRGLQ